MNVGLEAPVSDVAVAQERMHILLQALAGRVEDGQLTMARAFLAEGWIEDAAATAHDALESTGDGRPASTGVSTPVRLALDAARRGEPVPAGRHDLPSRWSFARRPTQGAEDPRPPAVPVELLFAHDVLGCWTAWRCASSTTAGGGAPGRDVLVHVLELAADAAPGVPARCAGVVQAALASQGLADPQVEVVRSGERVAPYQRAARAAGRLAWSARGRPRLRLARVDDGVPGSGFRPDHPVVAGHRRTALSARLAAGTVLLQTSAPLPDLVNPERPLVVADVFRTDGRWVWHEATAHYLRHYGLAPEPAFLRHLEGSASGAVVPPVDGVVLRQALRWLTGSAGSAPPST